MSLQCDNLSGELQDQWSSSISNTEQIDIFPGIFDGKMSRVNDMLL